MNKIICEVCGTTYQDIADHCPICGYSRSGVKKNINSQSSSVPVPEIEEEYVPEAPKKQKAIFDFDVENPDDPDEDELDAYVYDQRDGYTAQEEPSRFNIVAVIALVVLITLLLVAIGFLLFRFYLPGKMEAAAEPTTPPTIAVPTATDESTEPTIPCTSLVLTSGVTELNKEGQYWLLHVTVLPEDTTDTLVFTSEDETVATVNEHGRITAVGEGETNIYITCGEKEIKCRVVVNYENAQTTVPATEAETVPDSVEHSELPEDAAEETQAATEPEHTEETEPEKSVVLKLVDFDVSSNIRGVSFDLKLDCDLKPEDVTWLTLDSSVAIVRNGVVTTIGPGMTKIVAQYQGQQVECIVRCNF